MALVTSLRWHKSKTRYIVLAHPKRRHSDEAGLEVKTNLVKFMTNVDLPGCLMLPKNRLVGHRKVKDSMPNAARPWVNFSRPPASLPLQLVVSASRGVKVGAIQLHMDGLFELKANPPNSILDAIIAEMNNEVDFDVRNDNKFIYCQDGIQYAVKKKLDQGKFLTIDSLKSAQALDPKKPTMAISAKQGKVSFHGPFLRTDGKAHGAWGFAPHTPAVLMLLEWLVDSGLVVKDEVQKVNILLRLQKEGTGTQLHKDKARYGHLVYQISRIPPGTLEKSGLVFFLPPFDNVPRLSATQNDWKDYFSFSEHLQCPAIFMQDSKNSVLAFNGKMREDWLHGAPNCHFGGRLSITVRPRCQWTPTQGSATDPFR